MKVFVGITGASGSIYGIKLTFSLLELGHQVALCFSSAGKLVASEELKILPDDRFYEELISRYFPQSDNLKIYSDFQIDAQPASGSSSVDACVVCPCSVSTLSHIAYGTSRNLIHRCADVSLKEKKKLVLVVRETPLSLVHIKAMEAAALAGAIVMPASPGFYHNPQSIDDLVEFIVGKILSLLSIESEKTARYKKEEF